ncbi:S66 peptidase family protein [Plantactinospora soyae]|uniref:Muramoyltetrapeptide carboxypeptidase n=1 Tax=Plantactinospora soyae TaxID=1544732 RepID=A0A927M7I5_9ACTN|nr:LD-carboxypeptidase [Plantactinospora soyae]MBE1488031.1 muramoyltetrapeptide carboxypeptidase [Plantactinospora soyae]
MTDQQSAVTRRRLLRAGTVAAGGILAGGVTGGTALAAPASPPTPAGRLVAKPPALRPGDRVRIVAPARPADPALLARGVEILESWGLTVEIGAHVYDQHGFFAGTDADRLADLRAAFTDPGVRGVFACRGGYGTQRIVDRFNPSGLGRDPRVFVGFSDLTALHGRLWRTARLATFYGPVMNWNDARTGPASIESLRRAVMTTDPVTITRNPAEPSAAVMVPGRATGVLLGGTLTMLTTSFGAPDFPRLSGAILLFEDVDEAAYSVDRMLTQLRRVGALEGIAGVAVGQITNSSGIPGYDLATVLSDRLGDLGVPVLGGLPLGHGPGQLTVPLGVEATIDAEAGTLVTAPGVR